MIPRAPRHLDVYRVGVMPYDAAHALQRTLVEARKAGTIGDTLLLLEHLPVLTLGRGAKADNILFSREVLAAQGVSVEEVGRGGGAGLGAGR